MNNEKRNKGQKKNNDQKSFYFQDYENSEYIIKSKNNQTKVSLSRVAFIFFTFISLIFIFCVKIFYLTFSKNNIIIYANHDSKHIKGRADIVDRNDVILARNVNSYSVGIKPNLIKNKKKLLLDLKLIYPNLDFKTIENKIKKNTFFYIKKKISEEEKRKLFSLGNEAIEFEKTQTRFYPQKNLFSHVVGQIDEDNHGISGLEKSFDARLNNKHTINSSLKLTLDSNLQHIIREELLIAKDNFNTVGSAAILMDINNGEILSLLSLPDYDLNQRKLIKENIYTNKVTKGVYELGSVFKTFTLAAAIENKVINSDTMFNNLEKSLICAGRKISEHDKLPKDLSAEQILIRSSNIGAIRIAQKVGLKQYKNFLNSLGLFETINFDIEEIGTPLDFKWGKCKLATASFGHGITTTPLQLAKSYAILGNGGYEINPTIVKEERKPLEKSKQIISSSTSDTINSILRKVVSEEEGTANFANIKGYEVGGKTGTAYKSVNGNYDMDKKLNTFVSLFPTSRPEYILLVMLDEPKSAPNFVYEFSNGYKGDGYMRNTSGWNTVVVVGKIIEKIGPILAIKNLQASNKF